MRPYLGDGLQTDTGFKIHCLEREKFNLRFADSDVIFKVIPYLPKKLTRWNFNSISILPRMNI